MNYKIMIVEDELLERQALKKIIAKNFQSIEVVAEAEDGRQAIEFAQKYEPDIMLLDIGIPEINGLTAQREIIKFLPSIQTIIISAYSSFTYAQDAITNRVRDYLLKPVRPSILIERIQKTLNTFEKKSTVHEKMLEQSPNHSVIQRTLEIIKENYKENIRLDDVANEVHVNSQYLSRLFRQKMGITYSEYLILCRLEKATDLLLNTDYPIYRIATEIGFSDASYFCKVFSKYKQISPSKFRRK